MVENVQIFSDGDGDDDDYSNDFSITGQQFQYKLRLFDGKLFESSPVLALAQSDWSQ